MASSFPLKAAETFEGEECSTMGARNYFKKGRNVHTSSERLLRLKLSDVPMVGAAFFTYMVG